MTCTVTKCLEVKLSRCGWTRSVRTIQRHRRRPSAVASPQSPARSRLELHHHLSHSFHNPHRHRRRHCHRSLPPLSPLSTAVMWDDEDNNPYGSFARHDSSNDPSGLASPTARKLPSSPATQALCHRLVSAEQQSPTAP
jgi:hypothetical protein